MRLASSAWPSALLILCAPVWLRSSRLSQTARPAASRQPLGAGTAASGGPTKSRSSPSSSAAEAGVARAPRPTPPRARRAPASASRARTGRRRGRSGARRRLGCAHAAGTAAAAAHRRGTNAAQLRRVLDARARLGAAGDVDGERAATAAIASATFSGVSPPDRISGTVERRAPRRAPSRRSRPCRRAAPRAVRVEQVEVACGTPRSACRSAPARTRAALITLRAGAPARPRRRTTGPRRRAAAPCVRPSAVGQLARPRRAAG